VIIGTAGGEYGIRGFIAAYDAHTGREAWRFNTIQDRESPATRLGRVTPGKQEAARCG